MTDEVLRLTEMERIDFNRRVDIALATAPAASLAIAKRKELDDAIGINVKKSKSYWYWVVGVVGFAIHYFISGNENKLDFGVYVLLMTAAYWGAGHRKPPFGASRNSFAPARLSG